MSICTIAPYDKILLQIAMFPFLCFLRFRAALYTTIEDPL